LTWDAIVADLKPVSQMILLCLPFLLQKLVQAVAPAQKILREQKYY
jgi:hypothetical protein